MKSAREWLEDVGDAAEKAERGLDSELVSVISEIQQDAITDFMYRMAAAKLKDDALKAKPKTVSFENDL